MIDPDEFLAQEKASKANTWVGTLPEEYQLKIRELFEKDRGVPFIVRWLKANGFDEATPARLRYYLTGGP